ncbi:MAG: hypothetical protein ACFFCS_02435 [Candidatus Hodarchaeota archaeon]
MPEEISLSEDKKYILIKSFDEVKKEDVLNSLNKVIKIYEEFGLNRVLVDARDAEIVPGILEMFLFGDELADSTRDLKFRSALVIGEKKIPSYEFVETVVQNRGGVLKIFKDIKNGLKWLLE